MRLLLAILILFAALTFTFKAEASDCCQTHDCAVMAVDGAGDGCDGHANKDCSDCCVNSFMAVLPVRTDKVEPARTDAKTVFGDNFIVGLDPASLLKPPRTV